MKIVDIEAMGELVQQLAKPNSHLDLWQGLARGDYLALAERSFWASGRGIARRRPTARIRGFP